MMIPDATRRLVSALDDLYTLVGEMSDKPDVAASPEYKEAQALLDEHDALISG